MALGSLPLTLSDILGEIQETDPLSLNSAKARWLADAAATGDFNASDFAEKMSVKVTDTKAETAGATSKTFSGVDFGIAFADRILIACTGLYRNAETPLDITAVTIGGVSAVGYDNGSFAGGGPTCGAGIWAAEVPTGTSGDVVITHGGTASHAGLILLSISGISTTPHDEQTIPISGTVSTSYSDTINIPSNGALIVVSSHSNTNDTTLTGVTERSEITFGSARLCVGFDNRMDSETGRSIQAAWSGSTARGFTARSYQQS